MPSAAPPSVASPIRSGTALAICFGMPSANADDVLDGRGRNVRAARLRLGLTIEELAEQADLNVLLLDAIERGDGGRLDLLGLQRLASALRQTPCDLLT